MLSGLLRELFPRSQTNPPPEDKTLKHDDAFNEAFALYEAANYTGAEALVHKSAESVILLPPST